MIKVFGIKNCDTMKKTFRWFEANGIDYQFIDYKKEAPTEALASVFLAAQHWENIINKRGTTWRKLDDARKQSMDTEQAIRLIIEQPSVIKRPIVLQGDTLIIGYDEAAFQQLL